MAYEVIPDVPFPAVYRLTVTPEGSENPIAQEHLLQIVAPPAASGHAFALAIQPYLSLDTPGAFELMTARAPSSPPKLSGSRVRVQVTGSEYASPAQFRGLVGYETVGVVIASSGAVELRFWTDSEGTRLVSGTFDLTTTDTRVPPQLRRYRGRLNGVLRGSLTPGEGGGGPVGPPMPPY